MGTVRQFSDGHCLDHANAALARSVGGALVLRAAAGAAGGRCGGGFRPHARRTANQPHKARRRAFSLSATLQLTARGGLRKSGHNFVLKGGCFGGGSGLRQTKTRSEIIHSAFFRSFLRRVGLPFFQLQMTYRASTHFLKNDDPASLLVSAEDGKAAKLASTKGARREQRARVEGFSGPRFAEGGSKPRLR